MLNLLPRDGKYFDRFTDMARRIHESALILSRFFDEGDLPSAAAADQIKRLEHECDEISHEILRGIDQTFITPIDREDIHRLAVRLDDVIDLIDGTVRRVSLFNVSEPTPLSHALSQIIVQATQELVKAVSALRQAEGGRRALHPDQAARERGGRRVPRGGRLALPRPDRSRSRSSSGRTSTTTWSAASTSAPAWRTSSRASS